jgi:hypothetical protein
MFEGVGATTFTLGSEEGELAADFLPLALGAPQGCLLYLVACFPFLSSLDYVQTNSG